ISFWKRAKRQLARIFAGQSYGPVAGRDRDRLGTDMRQSLKRNFYPLPDALLGLYVLCTAREYLWALGGSHSKNVAAWTASAIVAGFLVWLWSAKRGTGWEGTESSLSAE